MNQADYWWCNFWSKVFTYNLSTLLKFVRIVLKCCLNVDRLFSESPMSLFIVFAECDYSLLKHIDLHILMLSVMITDRIGYHFGLKGIFYFHGLLYVNLEYSFKLFCCDTTWDIPVELKKNGLSFCTMSKQLLLQTC